MSEAVLTAERILETAEEVLRRFGPGKATVVDVARALGVSHGSVYRHFPSKAALRDAVAERWLARVSAPLAQVAAERGPSAERLRRWFERLIAFKRKKLHDDPELFATYSQLVAESGDVVRMHVTTLIGQLAEILADGAARDEIVISDARVTAQAVFDATTRFHNPIHAAEWSTGGIDDRFEEVFALVLAGLGVKDPPPARRPARRRR